MASESESIVLDSSVTVQCAVFHSISLPPAMQGQHTNKLLRHVLKTPWSGKREGGRGVLHNRLKPNICAALDLRTECKDVTASRHIIPNLGSHNRYFTTNERHLFTS